MIKLGDGATTLRGELVTPTPPAHRHIAWFRFDHEAGLDLRDALLQIEADPAKAPPSAGST